MRIQSCGLLAAWLFFLAGGPSMAEETTSSLPPTPESPTPPRPAVVILPRLFNVPTGDVLHSLDIYVNGGGAFGAEKERSVLARVGVGLGDVAEVEVSTWSVISTLRKTTSTIPTSAFKMQIFGQKGPRPSIAWALRGTTSWQQVQDTESSGAAFRTRLMKLYVVSSRRVGALHGHVGLGLTDIRVRDPLLWSFRDSSMTELQRNLLSPFAGFSYQANPRTFVMVEVEGVPEYRFHANGSFDKKAIRNVGSGAMGVRFYFSPFVAVDSGVRYRSDYDGIADANIHASMNILFPVNEMRRGGRRP